ncbi:MAG TPA: hypothetical protein V6D13_13085 [Halomicronema sp.]
MKSELLKTIVKVPDAIRKVQLQRFGGVSPVAVEAMQRLMVMVEQVGSPEGGWPAHLQPTPENLLPYLTEEVCEVLQALNEENKRDEKVVIFSSGYVLMADFVRRLLWFLAKSSPEIMRLVGGVQAEVQLNVEEDWKIGILRLVPVLEVKTVEDFWGVDLGTGEVWDGGRFTPRLIKFKGGFLGRDCVFSESLLERLQAIVLRVSPELGVFFKGFSGQVLCPYQEWLLCDLGLSWSWDFLEGVMGFDEDFKHNDEGFVLGSSGLAKGYFEDLVKDFLMGLPVGDLNCGEGEMAANLMVDSAQENEGNSRFLDVVSGACFLRGFLGEDRFFLEDFRRRILWQFIGCSEVVMQLVGGVRARVLQPSGGWEKGVFSLVPVLVVKGRDSGKLNKSIDLRTGDSLVLRGVGVVNDAMICSDECSLLRDLVPVGNLMKWVRKQFFLVPEMGLLLKGCEVSYGGVDGADRPVIVKLSLVWRLVAY